MRFLVAAIVAAPVIGLTVQTWRGRATVRACCPPADQDNRLQER